MLHKFSFAPPDGGGKLIAVLTLTRPKMGRVEAASFFLFFFIQFKMIRYDVYDRPQRFTRLPFLRPRLGDNLTDDFLNHRRVRNQRRVKF